jgi:hypothetical protein
MHPSILILPTLLPPRWKWLFWDVRWCWTELELDLKLTSVFFFFLINKQKSLCDRLFSISNWSIWHGSNNEVLISQGCVNIWICDYCIVNFEMNFDVSSSSSHHEGGLESRRQSIKLYSRRWYLCSIFGLVCVWQVRFNVLYSIILNFWDYVLVCSIYALLLISE